jgi:hypothetical protein
MSKQKIMIPNWMLVWISYSIVVFISIFGCIILVLLVASFITWELTELLKFLNTDFWFALRFACVISIILGFVGWLYRD